MVLDAFRGTLQRIGPYDLVQKIAEGGMGTVYKGRHQETGQVVAIKIVPPTMVKSATTLQRFEKEYKAASKLDHPNIVRALEYGLEDRRAFLVMEFVEGESLGQRVERAGRLPEAEAIRIIGLTAQGLHHAHKQGLIHRDVKPDNIMVTPTGQVKLADLGLVKEMDADLNLTRTGRGLGTPHFMAPEQFRNAKNADIRCDIYSLGATLYQLVTGELPFRSLAPLDAWMKKVNNELTPPRVLVPELSERIDWAIRRAMSPDPALRPESCREFVEDLTGHSSRKMRLPDQGNIEDIWFMAFKDEDGQVQTAKGTTVGIRRSYKEGRLGDATTVRLCRTKSGPFEPLKHFPEFRDLVVTPSLGNAAGLIETVPLDVMGIKAAAAKSNPRVPPAKPSPPASSLENSGPLIPLEVSGTRPSDWLKLLLVGLVAMILGLILLLYYFPSH